MKRTFRRNRYWVSVCVAAALAGGCTTTEETLRTPRQASWAEVDPADVLSATEEGDPEIYPVTHYAAGQLFEQQGHCDQALLQYHRAIELNPEFIAAYNRIGIVQARQQRHQQAEDAFMEAIELRPGLAFLRNNLAFIYILQKRWQDARAELINALELNPDFRRARINLGTVLGQLGDFDGAYNQFRQALDDADAYYNLGLIFKVHHRYTDAANAFRRSLQLNPRMAAAETQLERLVPHLRHVSALEPVFDTDLFSAGEPTPEPAHESTQHAPATKLEDDRDAQSIDPLDLLDTLIRDAQNDALNKLASHQTVVSNESAEELDEETISQTPVADDDLHDQDNDPTVDDSRVPRTEPCDLERSMSRRVLPRAVCTSPWE